MAEHRKPSIERRDRTRSIVERLLAERQQMLVLYARVAGIEPYSDAPPNPDLLREFASILVDYIAAGHFGVYGRIEDGTERRRAVIELADDLFPRIAETTEGALAFNDRVEQARGEPAELGLSELGEQIATRIDLEDRLLERLLA